MSEGSRPRLVALDPSEPGPSQPAPAGSGSRPRSWGAIALGGLLLLALVVLGLERRQAGHLEAQLRVLEAELTAARTDLAAHEAHRASVREAVAGVRGELERLESLAREDPTAVPEAP